MDGNMMDLEAMFNDVEASASVGTQAQQNVEVVEQQAVSAVETPVQQVVDTTPVQTQQPQMAAPQPQQTMVQTQQTMVQPQMVVPQQTVQQPVMGMPVQTQQTLMGGSTMPATMTPQQTMVQTAVPSDFSIGFSDEMESALADVGIETGEMGMKVSRVPIEKYKASASKVDRIGFITSRVIPVKFHYIEGVGSIVCNHGKCCELAGNPQVRYLFPIVVYTTGAEGDVTGGKVQLMMLSAGEDLYKTIQTIHKGSMSQGGIDHVDLLVTCTDEHYQKLSLVQAGPALWRQYSQIAQFLAEKWKMDGDKSYMAIARKVDNETLMKMMNMSGSDDAGDARGAGQEMAQVTDLSKFFS